MQKIIEYEDKVALYHNSNIPDINKVNDTDMNEIKTIVNGSLQGTNAMGSIVVDDINCKNTLNINSPSDWIGANTTYTISNDELTVSGNYFVTYLLNVKPNTDYYVSATRTITTSVTNTGSIRIFKIDKSTPITSHNTGNFTFNTGDNSQVYVAFYSGSGSNGVVKFSSVQIEEGSTATPYTPYKKIIKEENGYVKENTTFYANDFKCKNMFDKSNIVAGYLSNAGNVVSNTQYSTSYYINVKGIGNITISGSSGNSENICFYDSSQTFISFVSTGANATLTTSVPSNAYYCRITVKNTNLDLVQLEVGSEVTPYIEYKNFDSTAYVLWTNTNTGTAFNPQDVNISNLSDYKYYEIIYKLHATSLDYYQTSGKVPTGLNTCIGGGYARPSSTPRFWSRYVTYSNTKLTFSTGYYSLNFNDNASTANDILVPYQIIGYK